MIFYGPQMKNEAAEGFAPVAPISLTGDAVSVARRRLFSGMSNQPIAHPGVKTAGGGGKETTLCLIRWASAAVNGLQPRYRFWSY